MGYLYTFGEIHPLTGVTLGKHECDTIACAHCRAVIRIILEGNGSHLYDTKHKCERCRKPICTFCAGKGCSPDSHQIEESVKAKRWVGHSEYKYKGYVHGAKL